MENLKKDIVKLLREDARYSASKIAVMLGEDEKKVVNAIAEMEKDGTIAKYTVICDDDRIEDRHVEGFIEIKVTPQKSRGFDAIAEEIYSFPEVKSLFLMSGGFDLAVFIEGKSLKEVAMFVSEKLSTLDTVISTATHFVLKKYKTEGIILTPVETLERENIG